MASASDPIVSTNLSEKIELSNCILVVEKLSPDHQTLRVLSKSSNESYVYRVYRVEDVFGFEKFIQSVCENLIKNNETQTAKEVFEHFQRLHRGDAIKLEPIPEVIKFDIKKLEQVILPKEDRMSIVEALSQEQADHRKTLFVDWGFGTSFEKGKGVILLFYGLPGTGKTMLAEKIAEYLNKDHVMLGNAELQSQVPGQMERNIQQSFKDATKEKRVIIFDECDSLLTNRKKVGAILAGEINCLLSEIERFEGVCILTTNRNMQLDPALERRIALKVEFKAPDKAMRVRIWKVLVPKNCPVDKDVCFKELSKHNMQGGNIKNVIFGAARKAVYAGRKTVRMEDFACAVRLELKGMQAFKQTGHLNPDILQDADISAGVDIQRSTGLERFLNG